MSQKILTSLATTIDDFFRQRKYVQNALETKVGFYVNVGFNILQMTYPEFVGANQLESRVDLFNKFGKVSFNASEDITDEQKAEAINNCKALIHELMSFYNIGTSIDDIDDSFNIHQITEHIRGVNSAVDQEILQLVSKQNRQQLGLVDGRRFIDDILVEADGTAVKLQPTSSMGRLVLPDEMIINGSFDLGAQQLAEDSGGAQKAFDAVLFKPVEVGSNYERISDVVENEVVVPIELNVQVPITRGNNFPLEHFIVQCTYEGEYKALLVPEPNLPTVIQVSDNASSIDVGAVWSQLMRNGVLNATQFKTLSTLMTSYRWGYAKQPYFRETRVTVTGYLSRIFDKHPIGTEPFPYATQARLLDLLELEDGPFYVQTYLMMYKAMNMNEDFAGNYIISRLQAVLPKLGMFNDEVINDPIVGRNVVFTLADRTCTPGDVLMKAAGMTWTRIFKATNIKTELQVIASALLISLANKRERVPYPGFGNGRGGFYYKWTLFPLRNVPTGSSVRFYFNTAVFVVSMLDYWANLGVTA